jgi:hypothetical protein
LSVAFFTLLAALFRANAAQARKKAAKKMSKATDNKKKKALRRVCEEKKAREKELRARGMWAVWCALAPAQPSRVAPRRNAKRR